MVPVRAEKLPGLPPPHSAGSPPPAPGSSMHRVSSCVSAGLTMSRLVLARPRVRATRTCATWFSVMQRSAARRTAVSSRAKLSACHTSTALSARVSSTLWSRDGDQVPDIPDDNVQVAVMRQLDVADDEAAHLLHPHLVEGLPDGGEVEAEVQLAAVLQLEALHGRGDEAGEGEDGGAAAAALTHQLLVARQVDTVEVGVGGPGGGEAAGQEGEHQHQHPGACRRSLRV